MRKVFLTLMVLILVSTIVILCACDDRSSPQQITEQPDPEPSPSGLGLSPAAEPIAPPDNMLSVIDSYTENGKNYYLIDAGAVQNLYLSTLLQIYYAGTNGAPICVTKSKETKTTLSESVSETIASTITTSNTHNLGVKLGFEESGKVNLFGLAEVSVKFTQELSYGWENTKSKANSKSTTNTKNFVEERSTKEECAFNFEANSTAEHGYYRYAMYSTCDVYFEICTSNDNKNLESMNVVSCVRESEITISREYSKNGTFDNTAQEKMQISEDFYKYLPIPENSKTSFDAPTPSIEKYFKLTPSNRETATVKDHTQNAYFEINLYSLKEHINKYNLQIAKIKISLYITEENHGYQEVFLVNSSSPQYNWKKDNHVFDQESVLFSDTNIETAGTKKGSGWFTAEFRTNLDELDLSDRFYLFCGAHGEDEDAWTASQVSIEVFLVEA